MSKRYKEIVLNGLTITAPEGEILTICEKGHGKAEIQRVPEKKKPDNFFKITASKREKVKDWFEKQKSETGSTERENKFLRILSDALEVVNYDYEIATMEPTVVNGKIAYIKGKEVEVDRSFENWIKMAKEYLPERGSRLATLYELFIWYAWRIVKGYWTLHYVAEDSSSAGNYCNSPTATHKLELAGERKCGGFRDGQGNTFKLVTHKYDLVVVGGDYETAGCYVPVGNFYYCQDANNMNRIRSNACGVLVLTK